MHAIGAGFRRGSEKKCIAPSDRHESWWVWKALPELDYEPWEYLRGRGLDDASGEAKSVPAEGVPVKGREGPQFRGMRFAVPLRDAEGHVVAIQGRDFVSGGAHGFRVIGSSAAGVFGHPERLKDPAVEWVILAEGLTDYLCSVASIGADNPKALVLGVAGVENIAGFLGLPLERKRVVVATDADEAGDKCAAEVVAALQPKGARCYRARPALGAPARRRSGRIARVRGEAGNPPARLPGQAQRRALRGGRGRRSRRGRGGNSAHVCNTMVSIFFESRKTPWGIPSTSTA